MKPFKVDSFEELEEKLRNWVNFHGDGDYDFVGILCLFRACLENIRQYSIPEDFEGLENFFFSEDSALLREILKRH